MALSLLICWPGSAKANIPVPIVVKHSGVAVITQSDSASQLTGVAFFVRAGLDRQLNSQNGLVALTAETVVQSLGNSIVSGGGSVSYVIEGRDVRFYVEGPTALVPTLLGLFEGALRHPDFSVANVAAARSAVNAQIIDDQNAPLAVGVQMLDQQFYGNAGSGLPPTGTPSSLAQFVPADVQAFYRKYYVRGGGVISAIGSVDRGSLNALADTLPAGISVPAKAKVIRVHSSSRELIAHRDISSAWLVAQVAAPAPGSRDFAAMLVLNSFLNRTLADAASVPNAISHAFAPHALGTLYNFDQQPANDVIYVDGSLGDPTRTFATTFSVANLLGAAKLHGSIQEYKSVAQGEYSAEVTTLSDRAAIAGIFFMQTGSPEYLNGTLNQISRVTPKDLQHVIGTYLRNPTIALILPRNG